MALWIPVTILAAFVQNLRFLFQKRLTEAGLGPAAATLARFLYSSPVVLAVALALATRPDTQVGSSDPKPCATLIVVPLNLPGQWLREIDKFCEQ